MALDKGSKDQKHGISVLIGWEELCESSRLELPIVLISFI